MFGRKLLSFSVILFISEFFFFVFLFNFRCVDFPGERTFFFLHVYTDLISIAYFVDIGNVYIDTCKRNRAYFDLFFNEKSIVLLFFIYLDQVKG